MTTRERYIRSIEYFEKAIPVAETELHYDNVYQLIVAVILSAQCTDKRVNMTTPALFEAFPGVKELAAATPEEVFPYIRSISYPNNKSKHLVGMAQKVMNEFNGEIPQERSDLEKLPGVGRKTANVIASVAYDEPAMPVDTHVFRVSQRIGLVKPSKTPYQVEMQLLKHLPEELLGRFHHWLILHGRYVCVARKPKCNECGLTEVCKYYQKIVKKQQKAAK
jgi:endonuclease-3